MAEQRHPEARTLTDDAVILHEIFTSLTTAGFSEAQALYLIGQVMTGGRQALGSVKRLLGG